jgi:hypothetical protein
VLILFLKPEIKFKILVRQYLFLNMLFLLKDDEHGKRGVLTPSRSSGSITPSRRPHRSAGSMGDDKKTTTLKFQRKEELYFIYGFIRLPDNISRELEMRKIGNG